MITVKLVYEDGETCLCTFKSVQSFKRSPHSKDKLLKFAYLVDAVTQVIIALILRRKTA